MAFVKVGSAYFNTAFISVVTEDENGNGFFYGVPLGSSKFKYSMGVEDFVKKLEAAEDTQYVEEEAAKVLEMPQATHYFAAQPGYTWIHVIGSKKDHPDVKTEELPVIGWEIVPGSYPQPVTLKGNMYQMLKTYSGVEQPDGKVIDCFGETSKDRDFFIEISLLINKI